MAGITLTGPNPGQPFDIQTQQAQLAQAQQIAQAMIAQGLEGGGSPIIHTGGGNPFARDVPNWSGPLQAALKAWAGQSRLGDINEQQQGLAQEYNRRVGEGIKNYLDTSSDHFIPASFGDQGGPGDSIPATRPDIAAHIQPGDQVKALADAYGSGIGPVQELAKSMLGANVALAGKMMLTPEIKSGLIGHGVDPAAIEGATYIGRGPLGMPVPMLDTSKLFMQLKPESPRGPTSSGFNPSVNVPPESPNRFVNPIVTNPVSPVVPATAPGTPGPGIGLPTQTDSTGRTVVVPGSEQAPQVLAQKDQIKSEQDNLDKVVPGALATAKNLPLLVQIAQTLHRANMGQLGAAKQEIKGYLAALGINDDELNSVGSTQSLQALLIPRATAIAKEINSTRATQQVFNTATEAVGAGKTIDPRHTMDMLGFAISDGMNNLHQLNDIMVPRAREAGVPNPEKYYVEGKFQIPQGLPITIRGAPGADYAINENLTQPRPYSEATSSGVKPLETGTTSTGVKAYKAPRSGEWYTTEAEARQH